MHEYHRGPGDLEYGLDYGIVKFWVCFGLPIVGYPETPVSLN